MFDKYGEKDHSLNGHLHLWDAREPNRKNLGTKHFIDLNDDQRSDTINAGFADETGHRVTFGVDADQGREELRIPLGGRAHTAAMEHSCANLLARGLWSVEDLPQLTLADLPDTHATDTLLSRRRDLGLSNSWDQPVLVDDSGRRLPAKQVATRLRSARPMQISLAKGSHGCRGVLAGEHRNEDTPEVSPLTNIRRSES